MAFFEHSCGFYYAYFLHEYDIENQSGLFRIDTRKQVMAILFAGFCCHLLVPVTLNHLTVQNVTRVYRFRFLKRKRKENVFELFQME